MRADFLQRSKCFVELDPNEFYYLSVYHYRDRNLKREKLKKQNTKENYTSEAGGGGGVEVFSDSC